MKYLFTIIFVLYTGLFSYSQDVITFLNGEIVESKIVEISDSEIKYKTFNNSDGPLFVVSKEEIFMVVYSTGEKDVFERKSITTNEKKERYFSKGTKILKANSILVFDIINESLTLDFGFGGFVSDNFAILGGLSKISFLTEVSINGLYYANNGFFIGPSISYQDISYTNPQVVFRLYSGYAIFLNKSISIEPIISINITDNINSAPLNEFLIGGKLGIYLK